MIPHTMPAGPDWRSNADRRRVAVLLRRLDYLARQLAALGPGSKYGADGHAVSECKATRWALEKIVGAAQVDAWIAEYEIPTKGDAS